MDQLYRHISVLKKTQSYTLYKSRDLKTLDIVSIKELNEKYDSEFEIANTNEVKILSTLNHPNIVKIKKIFKDNETEKCYIVYDMLENSLQQYYEFLQSLNKTLLEKEIREILLQLVKVISYLQSKHIMHKSLNTSNIFVYKDTIKIACFEESVQLDNNDQYVIQEKYKNSWHNIYTTSEGDGYHYPAPELLINDFKNYYQSEMFAVGCIGIELFNQNPILIADKPIDILVSYLHLFGFPPSKEWEQGFKFLNSKGIVLNEDIDIDLQSCIEHCSDITFQLIQQMVTFTIANRITPLKFLENWYLEENKYQQFIMEQQKQKNQEIALQLQLDKQQLQNEIIQQNNLNENQQQQSAFSSNFQLKKNQNNYLEQYQIIHTQVNEADEELEQELEDGQQNNFNINKCRQTSHKEDQSQQRTDSYLSKLYTPTHLQQQNYFQQQQQQTQRCNPEINAQCNQKTINNDVKSSIFDSAKNQNDSETPTVLQIQNQKTIESQQQKIFGTLDNGECCNVNKSTKESTDCQNASNLYKKIQNNNNKNNNNCCTEKQKIKNNTNAITTKRKYKSISIQPSSNSNINYQHLQSSIKVADNQVDQKDKQDVLKCSSSSTENQDDKLKKSKKFQQQQQNRQSVPQQNPQIMLQQNQQQIISEKQKQQKQIVYQQNIIINKRKISLNSNNILNSNQQQQSSYLMNQKQRQQILKQEEKNLKLYYQNSIDFSSRRTSYGCNTMNLNYNQQLNKQLDVSLAQQKKSENQLCLKNLSSTFNTGKEVQNNNGFNTFYKKKPTQAYKEIRSKSLSKISNNTNAHSKNINLKLLQQNQKQSENRSKSPYEQFKNQVPRLGIQDLNTINQQWLQGNINSHRIMLNDNQSPDCNDFISKKYSARSQSVSRNSPRVPNDKMNKKSNISSNQTKENQLKNQIHMTAFYKKSRQHNKSTYH